MIPLWQYNNITFTKKDWKVTFPSTEGVWEALERLGSEGWEMIQCVDSGQELGVIFLKKPIDTPRSS